MIAGSARFKSAARRAGRLLPLLALGLPLPTTFSETAPLPMAERAASYEAALDRAKTSGADIVVLQRGSDWNRLGEILYNDVWRKDEFARALGERFILVTVDLPEVEGGTALTGPFTPADGVLCDRVETEPVSTPSRRIAKLADAETLLPTNEVTAVASPGGAIFKQRADGAWVAEGPNPAHDVLTLQLKTARGGQVLRLDFPTDPSQPHGGPGRAGNGNFVLTEVEVLSASAPMKLTAAWSSTGSGDAGLAIDGVSDKKDRHWSGDGHHHVRRTLLLAMPERLKAGAELTVRLFCRSPWGYHMPGCLRAAVLPGPGLAADLAQAAAAQAEKARSNRFSWWDTSCCPRVALLDCEGRAVACENKPRRGLTAATLAARIKELQAVREKRDALWARAEAAQGPERAELLRQGLDAMGFANWAGNDNGYKPVHDKIRAADPKDESGAVRWLTFGGDPRDGLQWAEPSWSKALDKKEPTDDDFKEALARIDMELNDPRNRVLDRERIQRIMAARYLVYSRWPKHEEQRYDVQREIAAFAPDTFWGIGARGDLGLHHRTATPMLTYGWDAKQVKPGLNAWDMTDTAYFFDHAGPYKVRLTFTGGKDGLKILRVALLDGATLLSEARPGSAIGPTNAWAEADLDFTNWRADRKVTLRVEAEATDGHTDIAGSFEVEPQLLPAPAVTRPPAATDETSRMLARGEIGALQQRLGASLLAEAARGREGIARAVESPALRASLAQSTLLRLCGVEKAEDIATREGGAAFLQSFFKDTDWLESFLASDQADWPQALENIHVLSRHGAAGWEQPLNRRLATALALQWGNGSPYRLVDRFRHVQQALRDGLMHVSFERLNVRELRWAVPTYGTAMDFQFLLDDRQTRLRDYLGAHGGIRYVSFNVFGVTVQDGWNYIGPWAHVYGNGMGNRPFPAHKQVGGVCGTVSTYGSAAAQAHGIPSTAICQPGHCAFIVRVGQEWPVGNSVTWPSSANAPGWDGTGYPALHRLYEPVNQDRVNFMKAARLSWLAQLQADRATPRVRVLPALGYSLYRRGVGAGLPDFSQLTPDSTGTCRTIDLASVRPTPPENFGVVWKGQIEAAGAGPIRVRTQSDDGSRVLVDGRAIAEANCSAQEKELELAPGRHDLRVEFSQGSGALNLSVSLKGALPAGATNWMQTYQMAIAAQPSNYGTWLGYVGLLETVKDLPPRTWAVIAGKAARSLAVCNEAGWAIARRCLDKALPGMKPAERVEALAACNRELRQERSPKFESFPYDGLLDWQADALGDPALALAFFGQLLAIHHSPKPDDNWIFGTVLNWGANRFGGNAKTAPGYAQAANAFFHAQGAALETNLLAVTVQTGIRKASEAGDFASYRLWRDMAGTMLPALKPGDVHLDAKQATAFPKFGPFPGDVLSRDGMLQTSSAHSDDRPLSYRQVLSGGFGGWFDADDEKPWAQVQLAGEGELSGVVLVNRYESAPAQEDFLRSVPLRISVSTDGKAWTEVASFDKAEAVFRVDLQGRKLVARYVRAERMAAAGKAPAAGRFHLRGFLVYGRKLY